MKLKGESLWSIAGQLKISYECARKWWRRGKKEGLAGLGVRKRGKPKQGILSKFEQEVCQASVILKRQHKRWGAARVVLATLPIRFDLIIYGSSSQHRWSKKKYALAMIDLTNWVRRI